MKFCELGNITDASEIAREPRKLAKATVQRGGRLGFSKTAGELLRLSEDKRIMFIANGVEELFAKIVGNDEIRGFRLVGSKDYISMPAKEFLEKLGIPYQSTDTTYIYDITEHGIDEDDQKTIWKFKLRMVPANHRTRMKGEVSSDANE